jgi:hypothetical protein
LAGFCDCRKSVNLTLQPKRDMMVSSTTPTKRENHMTDKTITAVTLHLDDSRAGSGLRPWLVIATGPKWVTVLSAAQLSKQRLSVQEYQDALVAPLDERTAGRLVKTAKRTARDRKALGLSTLNLRGVI